MLTQDLLSAAAAADAAAAAAAAAALLANDNMLCFTWLTAPAQPVFHEQHDTSVTSVGMLAQIVICRKAKQKQSASDAAGWQAAGAGVLCAAPAATSLLHPHRRF